MRTAEVILSDTQIRHIETNHPDILPVYGSYLPHMIAAPDYILEANKPNTALILKQFAEASRQFKLILRLQTFADPAHYKNSVITFMKIDEKEWRRLLRNKKILYKSNHLS